MKPKVISTWDEENTIYLPCGCGCGILVITQYIDNVTTPTGKQKDIVYDLSYYSHFKIKHKKFDWSLSLSQEQMKTLTKLLTKLTTNAEKEKK